MIDFILKMNLKTIKKEARLGILESSDRLLHKNCQWLSEIFLSLRDLSIEDADLVTDSVKKSEEPVYFLAKSLMASNEYDRAAFFTEHCKDKKVKFLHYYSKYLSAEKKKLDNLKETSLNNQNNNKIHQDLYNQLRADRENGTLDGYSLYLYGIVLKKLQLTDLAREVLIESLTATPLLWGAWLELASIIVDRGQLNELNLPDHWIKPFFMVRAHLELVQNEEAIEILDTLKLNGFYNCPDVSAQLAVAYNNKRDVEKSLDVFRNLRAEDPYRLDNLDIYSNLLYVKEFKTELANLAHAAVDIEKYRVETCCIIGNYYSMRAEHQKAVLYFQRALRLNPNFCSAWTLIGHEFMELKNTSAAIHSYRAAIEVNRRDYRAWYGLGQTYEILKMPFYCLYYYKEAQQLRPSDSRMLIALGETYEKLDRCENALKCYFKALNVGDIEGMALLKSAKLYDKMGNKDRAADAYTEFCIDESRPIVDKLELHIAYKFLANYHAGLDEIDLASHYAYKCLEHDETKNEGKSLLKMVACKRAELEQADTETGGPSNIEEVAMDESEADENLVIGE